MCSVLAAASPAMAYRAIGMAGWHMVRFDGLSFFQTKRAAFTVCLARRWLRPRHNNNCARPIGHGRTRECGKKQCEDPRGVDHMDEMSSASYCRWNLAESGSSNNLSGFRSTGPALLNCGKGPAGSSVQREKRAASAAHLHGCSNRVAFIGKRKLYLSQWTPRFYSWKAYVILFDNQ